MVLSALGATTVGGRFSAPIECGQDKDASEAMVARSRALATELRALLAPYLLQARPPRPPPPRVPLCPTTLSLPGGGFLLGTGTPCLDDEVRLPVPERGLWSAIGCGVELEALLSEALGALCVHGALSKTWRSKPFPLVTRFGTPWSPCRHATRDATRQHVPARWIWRGVPLDT